ncbi:MAG TPA: hypothetical protein VIV60_25680 [Polyangiaceae bacterium]
MQDPTPITWQDGVTLLNDANFNTEIRNAYLLMLNPPICMLTRSTNFSVPNGASWTAISWDTTALADTEAPVDPMFASGSPTRITVRTAGWYECLINVGSLLPQNIIMTFGLRVNGTTVYALGSSFGQNVTVHRICSASMLLSLAVTDYVEVVAQHNDTVARTVEALGNMPNFALYRRRGI